MTIQHSVTIIAPVRKDRMNKLQNVLHGIKKELMEDKHIYFEDSGTIHFCRWIILDEADVAGEHYEAGIVYSSNFDGPVDKHLTEICAGKSGSLVDHIYENCEDFPPINSRTPESRVEYLKRWQVPAIAFYAGAPGRSLQQIRMESELRNRIRNFLNTKDWSKTSASEVHRQIKEYVLSQPDLEWAKTPVQLPKVKWLPLILIGLFIIIPLLPFLLIWLAIVQFFYERKDVPLALTPSTVDEEKMKKLEAYEDLIFQNQFTQLLYMKPGNVRLFTLRMFMTISRALVRYQFVENNIMGIPTIHFAKWVMINKSKRMLFFSNFDGSWQQYLGDFIDKSDWGLTGVWSNTIGFPKTRFSFFGGADDAQHFLGWSRHYEIQTQAWYSAYPNLSIKNIVNNSHIRADLYKNLDEVHLKQFLKRF